MLCFEGIARMLNIFNRRIEPPSYKLHPLSPIESITVTEEVWICIDKVGEGTKQRADDENSPICLWRHIEKCQIYSSEF
jgi:hypothetical protein